MAKTVLLSVVICVLITNAPGAMRRVQGPAPRVVEITAQRFEFWPSEIRAQQDEVLELRIRSDDTMHGFRIIGAGVSVLVPKRGKGEAIASFTASRPGRYTIECSRMCGAGHNFMRATLVVDASSTTPRSQTRGGDPGPPPGPPPGSGAGDSR